MLRFNTFRASRYLRSKFVEGKYLLASEATDLELELIDLFRSTVKQTLGDNVAIDDAWKVTRLNATQILIAPGEAWFQGLPFNFRFGKDELVSGAIFSIGTVPVGVTVADDSTGLGKIITFNNGFTTPSSLYRLVVSASEELITDIQDPFLKNVNITEDTAQKIRLHFQLNIVPESLQTESPVPYRDETGTSGSVTNFPNAGGFAAPNYVNRTRITPTSGQNGELLATNIITGSAGIDGRSVELTLRNDPGLGGGNPLPNSTIAQQAYSNSWLEDSYGSKFYINAIFNDTVNTQVIIRIDQEYGQPLPQIVNTLPFYIYKRDVFVTDDINGLPQGKLNWPIANINFNSSNGIVHESSITDLRTRILKEEELKQIEDKKYTVNTINGGNFNLDANGTLLSWDADIDLVGPSFPTNSIPAGSSYLIDGGFLVYELNLSSGGPIAKGNLSVTSTSSGTSISLSGSPNLSSVSIGNIFVVGSNSAKIIAIDNVNKVLTLATSVSSTGSSTIYLDSYASASYITEENSYVLATKSGTLVWVADKLALSAGQTAKLGSSGGTGISKVTAYDPVHTSLPTGTTVTIDGYSVVNGDTVLFTALSSGNNEVYKVSGVGTSLSWSPIGNFNGQLTPTTGDLVIFTQGSMFANQIAEFDGTNFVINDVVRHFNGTDYWEQSSLQTSTLNNNSSGTVFSTTASGSENIIVDFSISRGGVKETGTIWITHDDVTPHLTTGGAASSNSGISFSASISTGTLSLNYTADNSGTFATMKYSVKRWSDNAGGPSGLPSYTPNTNTILYTAFVMSNNSGTPLNCNPTFNVSGLTRVQLSFNYLVGRNSGATVGDLDVYVNGQRYPRFISGVTIDGYYKEINSQTIEFNSDLTISSFSIEIVKKV